MRLIVGAPVANRAWALPAWFECLAQQTRRPDGFAFIHSGHVGDATWQAIRREASRHGFHEIDLQHDPRPPHPRHDNARYATLADLRNDLLAVARDLMQADLLLSLDTDILLQGPETIERLELLIAEDGVDVAGALTFLHPAAPHHWGPAELPGWAYNFGFFQDPEEAPGPRRAWLRPPVKDIPWGSKIRVDIPMAVWLGNRKAMWCEYSHHESGEDIGFAGSLQAAGARCVTDTGLYARHVWADIDLRREELVGA